MRNDPASGAIVVIVRSLKVHGMAQAVTNLMQQGDAAVPVLSQLLKAGSAVGILSAQGCAVPGVSGSGRPRLCQQRGQRSAGRAGDRASSQASLFSTVELVNALEQEKPRAKAGRSPGRSHTPTS
jgi:hypothetical protein